jgi:glycosyltransferase involved in cell wall biosynthesis
MAELRTTRRPPRLVRERLWVRRHFLPIPFHSATWLTSRREANRVGQRLLAAAIRCDLQRLEMWNPILIAALPHVADLVPLMPHRAVVYHCADDYAHAHGFPRTLAQVEADLCQMANLVITTSETLCQERHRFNPNTHWVPNGADVEHFSRSVVPAPDLEAVPRPIVGFIGGLSEWVDLSLVAYAARQRPDWSFVLIGPLAVDITPLRAVRNVRLIGPRPYAALPSYLAGMDVGVIPFKKNRLTYHADPIKAYEYLAAGVPVVATDLPALRRLAHVVRLADSPAAFVAQIAAAIEEGRDTRRVARQVEARRHSWTTRFDTVRQLLCETLTCAC